MESSIGNKLDTLPSGSSIQGFEFKPRQSWDGYNLHTNNVFFQGADTGMQAIVYKGNFVAFRSKHYHVFPHEDIFVTLDPVMAALNGEPLTEKINVESRLSMVYGNNKRITVEADWKKEGGKKIIYGTKVRSEFIFKDEKFDVTGDGDFVQFGATIGNDISGQGSLYISPYSWRQTCKNGMMHLSSVVEISEKIIKDLMLKKENLADVAGISAQIESIMESSKSFDELARKIKKERMSHVTKIPVEWISNRVHLLKESAKLFRERYREMTEMIVSQEQAELIAKNMPKRLTETLDWMEVKEEETDVKTANGMQKAMQRIVTMKTVPTQWKAFNDITENLTHVERAFDSRTKHYRQLDQILVVQ